MSESGLLPVDFQPLGGADGQPCCLPLPWLGEVKQDAEGGGGQDSAPLAGGDVLPPGRLAVN
jgi:hypothetical protein